MAGPAEVTFPGKQQQRMRMRGTKQASISVQKKLGKNLENLLDNPHIAIPAIIGPTSRGILRRDKMKGCMKEVEMVARKKENQKWLKRRMAQKGGDLVARALAGSLIAAHEEEITTVAIFKHPVYGTASYVRRGTGRPTHLVGIQMHSNSQIRLLAWEELARNGYWFFSWGDEFICTGMDPAPPLDWLTSCLRTSSLRFEEPEGDGSGTWSTHDEGQSVNLAFDCGVEVCVGLEALKTNKESFVQSIALSMSPPKLVDITEIDVSYRPEGWPEDGEVSEAANEAMNAVIERWLRLEIEDTKLTENLHDAFAEQCEDGLIIGHRWYSSDDRDSFLDDLQGGALEKEAISAVLDSIEGGIRVDASGEGHWLSSDLVRLEDGSTHSLLNAVWGKHGMDVLETLFDLTGDAAEDAFEKQLSRGKAFGSFLRKVDGQQSGARLLRKFPWDDGVLPSPLDFADTLVKKARADGIGTTTGMARKAKGDGNLAMGWAWLSAHGKGEGEAWHFDPDIRDWGGDWVPCVDSLWAASEAVGDSGDVSDYVAAMELLRTATGTMQELPDF
jgi:hypothetical protein